MNKKKILLVTMLAVLLGVILVLVGFAIAGYDIIKMITQPAVLTVAFILILGGVAAAFFVRSKK